MMDFSKALTALKEGKAVCRKGWNGKSMFVYMIPSNAYPAMTGVAKEYFKDGLVPYEPYLAIKNTSESVNTWVPSISDLLAEDWEIYTL